MHGRVTNEIERSHVVASLKSMKLPFAFWFENIFKKRSVQENKFYRKFIVRALAEEIGEREDSVHCELIVRNALIEEKYVEGKVVFVVEAPSSMSTIRFRDYVEKCILYAHDKYNVRLAGFEDTSDEVLNFHGRTREMEHNNGRIKEVKHEDKS